MTFDLSGWEKAIRAIAEEILRERPDLIARKALGKLPKAEKARKDFIPLQEVGRRLRKIEALAKEEPKKANALAIVMWEEALIELAELRSPNGKELCRAILKTKGLGFPKNPF